MSKYRQYTPEQTIGTTVSLRKINDRRALIGKRIEWNTAGWSLKRSGVVHEISGKNMLIGDNWEWSDNLLNVKLCE